jgi:hypothetical protein
LCEYFALLKYFFIFDTFFFKKSYLSLSTDYTYKFLVNICIYTRWLARWPACWSARMPARRPARWRAYLGSLTYRSRTLINWLEVCEAAAKNKRPTRVPWQKSCSSFKEKAQAASRVDRWYFSPISLIALKFPTRVSGRVGKYSSYF